MKKSALVVALLAAGAAACPSSTAEAASVGASVGYGVAGGTPNAYGLGFLGRIGFTLPMDFYLGGTFVYHLGTSADGLLDSKVSRKLWYAGAEFGYVIGPKDYNVRPYLGVGGIVLSNKTCTDGICTEPSNNGLYFGPGVYGQYNFGPMYVGADVRYIAAANGDIPNSFGFFGSLGVNF